MIVDSHFELCRDIQHSIQATHNVSIHPHHFQSVEPAGEDVDNWLYMSAQVSVVGKSEDQRRSKFRLVCKIEREILTTTRVLG
jgi:hypothetical protein